MLELINNLSLLDDILIILGVFAIAYGQANLGLVMIVVGLGIMLMKGEIGVPVK